MDKLIVAIDSTKLNALQLCARKYDLVFNNALSPLSKPEHLERGDLMHKTLQYYYVLRKYRTRWAQNNRTHADIVKICLKIGEHYAIKLQLDPEEVGAVLFQFTEYCEHYEHDGWDRIISVEQIGSFVLYEDNEIVIIYDMKMDLVLQLDNNLIIPVDHKTVKQRKPPEQLSNQFIGYCYGLGVNNVMINRIGFQKTLKREERFQRFTLSYPNAVLEEWRNNTIWWIKQLLNHIDTDFYPANFTSCDKWGGCVFQTACGKEPIARDVELLRSFDVAEHWDVGRSL